MREDVAVKSSDQERQALLDNAPVTANGLIKVPAIIDERRTEKSNDFYGKDISGLHADLVKKVSATELTKAALTDQGHR